jgi:ABC-type molybdate transport system substrate-binding protein
LEIANKIASYLPVNRNGWWIKFSVVDSDNILLVFTSMYTGQTVVRYYNNEDDAVSFIDFVIECDPAGDINP